MPKGKIKAQDVADVYMKFADGKVRWFGCMNTTGIEKTVDTEDIRCGIGAGLSGIVYSNSDMTLAITPAWLNEWLIEYQTGDTFTSGSRNVWVTEDNLLGVTSTTNATVTITGTPVGGIVKVQDADGKLYTATYLTGTVTITSASGGKYYSVSYEKAVTADMVEFRNDTYPEAVSLILKTVAYDINTGLKTADLYFEFDRVISYGNLSLSLTLQTNTTNGELTFRVIPLNNIFGRYVSVPVI
jgi:hypothetical protein